MTVSAMSSDEARMNWCELLDQVLANQAAEIVIERYSKPLAVVVNHTAWDKMKKAHIAMLDRLSVEMDEDPSMPVSWAEVKQGMKERGLLDE